MKIYTMKIRHTAGRGKKASAINCEKWIRLEDFREAVAQAYYDSADPEDDVTVDDSRAYAGQVIAEMEEVK